MTVKRMLLFGYGSIGQRHAANLKALRPEAELVIHDPVKGYHYGREYYKTFDAAIIATPTWSHSADMRSVVNDYGCPFLVEKPLYKIGEEVHFIPRRGGQTPPIAINHQYRFSAVMPEITKAAARTGVLHFTASEDLQDRYGPSVDEIIACHPIDTALWLLGPAFEVNLDSDGLHFHGSIKHERGISTHEYWIDRGPRLSTVTSGKAYDLPTDNQMYLDALAAWLTWVEGGQRDPRTCTLAEGLAVMKVLEQVRHVEKD